VRASFRDGQTTVTLLARLRTIRMFPDTPGLHSDRFVTGTLVAMAEPVKRDGASSGATVRRPRVSSAITTRLVANSLNVPSVTLKLVARSRSAWAAIHAAIEIDW